MTFNAYVDHATSGANFQVGYAYQGNVPISELFLPISHDPIIRSVTEAQGDRDAVLDVGHK